MGAALVPFSFLTVWEMTFALPAATFAGLLCLLGAYLLDPPPPKKEKKKKKKPHRTRSCAVQHGRIIENPMPMCWGSGFCGFY